MAYDDRRQYGKFQPQVSYNVPVLNIPQSKEIRRPDINAGNIGSIGGRTTQVDNEAKAAEEEAYQQGLNDYARRVNEIAEGQRQGKYDVATAEMYTRQLDDRFLGYGYKAQDLYKVRDKYDGGIRRIEEDRQKLMVQHEQNRLLEYYDNFRKNYNMPSATDEEIDSLTKSVDNMFKSVRMYRDIASREGISKEEKEQYMAAAGLHGQKLATTQSIMSLYGIINDPNYKTDQLTPQLRETLRTDAMKTLHDQLGVSHREAAIITDRMLEESGIDYLFSDDFRKLEADNEYVKAAVDNLMNHTKLDIMSRSPNLRTAMIIGGENTLSTLTVGDPASKKMFEDAVQEITNYVQGIVPNIDPNTAIKATDAVFNNTHQPPTLCEATFNNACDIIETTFKDPMSLSDTDLQKQLDNITNAEKWLSDPKKLSKITNKAEAQRRLEQIADAKAITTGSLFAANNQDFTRTVDALKGSFQEDRLSIDSNGMLRLAKETTGAMSAIGNFLGYEGTRQQVETVNNYLSSLKTPKERAAALLKASKGSIGATLVGTELVDTSKQPLTGMIKEGITKASTAVLSRMSPENPERNAEAINRMWTGEVEPEAFTGETPITESSKVSNKTTLSNAWVSAKPAVENYESMIQQSASRYNIDPEYLDLIAAIETRRGNNTKTSSAGAQGIMQFMPKTWREEVMPNFEGFTEDDIHDPQKSIEAAAWYLDRCKQFAQSIKPDADPQEIAEIQAACYNAGAGNVKKAFENADGSWNKAKKNLPDETKKYVGYISKHYMAEDTMNDIDATAEDRNNELLTEELIQYIDYDKLPEEVKRKLEARKRIHEAAEANRKK